MSKAPYEPPTSLHKLPDVNFRHLEVFQTIYREGSYANAAIELHTTRANVKRVCESLEKEFNHALFEEVAHDRHRRADDKALAPTPFGIALLSQCGLLARSFLHLGEGIRALQRKGRILRFAASNDYFHDGAFSIILSRIDVVDMFRPCYIRMEPDRFKAALLSSECDIYFGAGITASSRLEIIHLDRIPWSFHPGEKYTGKIPKGPGDLVSGKWVIKPIGDEECVTEMLASIHQAGAKNGRLLREGETPKNDEILLKPEPSWMGLVMTRELWPKFLFSAVLKKQHPYAELTDRLKKASLI